MDKCIWWKMRLQVCVCYWDFLSMKFNFHYVVSVNLWVNRAPADCRATKSLTFLVLSGISQQQLDELSWNLVTDIPGLQRTEPNGFDDFLIFHLMQALFHDPVKYINIEYMDWHKIWYRHLWFLEDVADFCCTTNRLISFWFTLGSTVDGLPLKWPWHSSNNFSSSTIIKSNLPNTCVYFDQIPESNDICLTCTFMLVGC